MTRQTFNMQQVTEFQTALQAAPSLTTSSKMSKTQVLRELAPVLNDLRENRGYTLESLAELLKEKGLDVKVSTLQGALKKKGANSAGTVTASRTDSPAVS